MGVSDFFYNIFNETSEEIKEDILENQQRIKEINKELRKKKNRQLQQEKKELNEEIRYLRTKLKKKDKNSPALFWTLLIIIGIVVLIPFIPTETHPCRDLIGSEDYIGCISIDSDSGHMHNISLYFINRLENRAFCRIETNVFVNNVRISEGQYDLGQYEPGEMRKETIVLQLPEGVADFNLIGSCS